MAVPMTPQKLLAVLKAEGLSVREWPGWERRCRCCPDGGPHRPVGPWDMPGRGWGDVKGQLAHITGGDLGRRTVEEYIRDIMLNDPKLPLKSQTVIDPDGVVWLLSAGRCNHAGRVGGHVREHMIVADFSLTSPYDSRFRGSDADGNGFTYGDECIAAKAMNAKQYTALCGVHAARARHFGWTGQESVGHGEVSSARVSADPNLDMGRFRRDVMARVAKSSGTIPHPAPESAPTAPPTPLSGVSELTVRTINLAAKAKAWQRATFDTRLPFIRKEVGASMAAIVCLQEAGSKSYIDKLKKYVTVPLGYEWAPGGRNWRYILFDPKQVTRVKSGSFYLGMPGKHAAWALVKDRKNGKELFVVSTHLLQGHNKLSEMERDREARSMLKQIKAANATNAPVIVAGDFNSYNIVGDRVMKPGGFKDTLDTADTKTDYKYNTFNGRKTVAVPTKYSMGGEHDDHLYASNGIYTVRWDLNPSVEASDHNAIAARIRY